MQNSTSTPTREQMADALDVVRRLHDIVAVYGPEFVHGTPKSEVTSAVRRLLSDLTEFVPPKDFRVAPAAEFASQPRGRYDF